MLFEGTDHKIDLVDRSLASETNEQNSSTRLPSPINEFAEVLVLRE